MGRDEHLYFPMVQTFPLPTLSTRTTLQRLEASEMTSIAISHGYVSQLKDVR